MVSTLISYARLAFTFAAAILVTIVLTPPLTFAQPRRLRTIVLFSDPLVGPVRVQSHGFDLFHSRHREDSCRELRTL